jgi:hypothetical protein
MRNNQLKNIEITSKNIVVGNKEYRLSRIENVWVKKLGISGQLLRLLALMLQFSCVGWFAQYWVSMTGFGFYLPALLSVVGLLYALFTFRKYELKALLSAVDETGKQPITIASTAKTINYKLLKDIEYSWHQRDSHNKAIKSDA